MPSSPVPGAARGIVPSRASKASTDPSQSVTHHANLGETPRSDAAVSVSSLQRPDLQVAAEAGQPPNRGAQLPGGGARLSEHPHGVRRRRRGLHPPREGQFTLQTVLWPADR